MQHKLPASSAARCLKRCVGPVGSLGAQTESLHVNGEGEGGGLQVTTAIAVEQVAARSDVTHVTAERLDTSV